MKFVGKTCSVKFKAFMHEYDYVMFYSNSTLIIYHYCIYKEGFTLKNNLAILQFSNFILKLHA